MFIVTTIHNIYHIIQIFSSISLKLNPCSQLPSTQIHYYHHIYIYVQSITPSKLFPLLDPLDNHNYQSPTLTQIVIYGVYYKQNSP